MQKVEEIKFHVWISGTLIRIFFIVVVRDSEWGKVKNIFIPEKDFYIKTLSRRIAGHQVVKE